MNPQKNPKETASFFHEFNFANTQTTSLIMTCKTFFFFLMRLGFTFLALLILKIVELGQRAYNSHNVIDMPLHAVKIGIRVATS
jgi:hypothetical protein